MIVIEEFASGPIRGGESRILVLSGDGPFQVTVSCFVDDPPPGFRPCAACGKSVVEALSQFRIHCDEKMWREKKGRILVDIMDTVGTKERLSIEVLADSAEEPSQVASA